MAQILALCSDAAEARRVATEVGGLAYVPAGEARPDDPFAALVRAEPEHLDALRAVGDVGLYRIEPRQVKRRPIAAGAGEPSPGVVAAFALNRRPDLTHEQADAHWRDTHAPLAVHHHVGMWDYAQLSITERLSGPDYDGAALCAFASREDLRERFFDGPEGRAAILADIAKFADTNGSPRRVIMTEWPAG